MTIWTDEMKSAAMKDAARVVELDGLARAAVAELRIISQIASTDPARVKMLADNAIAFLRDGIEKQ